MTRTPSVGRAGLMAIAAVLGLTAVTSCGSAGSNTASQGPTEQSASPGQTSSQSSHGPSASPSRSSSSGPAALTVCALVTKREAQLYLPPIRWVYFLRALPANPATHFPAGSLCGYYPFPAGTTNVTAPIVVVILDKAKTTAGRLRARMATLSPSPVPDTALDAVAYYQSNAAYQYLYAVKHGIGILVETRGLSITKAHVEQLAKDALSRIP